MNIASVTDQLTFSQNAFQTSSPELLAEQRDLRQAVRVINASGELGQNSELTFAIDRATQRSIIRIVNRETGELVLQLPAENVLRLAAELRRL